MSPVKDRLLIIRYIVPLLVLLLFPYPVHALTLKEAISLALQNNHRIKEYINLMEAQRSEVDSKGSAFLPEINLGYSLTQMDKELTYQGRTSSGVSAEFTYNLFNGFIDARELEAERQLLDAATFQKRAVEADIVLAVKNAYIELLRTKKNLRVAEEAVELLKRQKKDIGLYYREGLVAKNEVLKVEVELASSEQGLLSAESSYRRSRKALERFIGIDINEMSIGEIESAGQFEPDEEKLLDEMVIRRSELNYLMALKREKQFRRDAIKGEYLPTVDFSLTHVRYGDSIAPGGRDDLHDTETRAMVVAKWNIFEGFKTKYDLRVKESEIMAVEERINDTIEELRLQLRTALEEYRVSAGRVVLAEKAVLQAEENYRITENQFRQRVATTTDLLDARVFLSRARNDLNNAFYDKYLAMAEIERVVEAHIPWLR